MNDRLYRTINNLRKNRPDIMTDLKKIRGIGPATEEKLKKFGVLTVEDLLIRNEDDLKVMLGIKILKARDILKQVHELLLSQATELKSLDDILESNEQSDLVQ